MILGVGSFAHSIGSRRWRTRARRFQPISPAITAISRRRWSGQPFRATRFPARFRSSRKTAWRSSSRNPLIGRWHPGRRICCNRASAFSVPRARRCASSASATSPASCARISKFPFRRPTLPQTFRRPKKSWRSIRSRSSLKIRFARRPAQSTRSSARRSRTRARGCGTSIMPRVFFCRNTSAAPRWATSCW